MKPRRPNILLITSDQQHFDTLGVTNPRIRTPALDRLAHEGVRFERSYCVNPVCSPSRSTIITGLYPAWHHCWTIGVKLPEDVPTVGDLFSKHGYATTLIGKAHFQPLASAPGSESLECQPTLRDLEFWRGFHGPWYGFQHIEVARNHADESHAGQHYALWMEQQGLDNWRDFFWPWPHSAKDMRKRRHTWDLPEQFHYSKWTADRTIANIERAVDLDKPFFMFTNFHDPHPPYLAPEPWASVYHPDDMVPGTLANGELERLGEHFQLTQQPKPDCSWYHEEYYSHGFHSHVHNEADLRKDMAVYYGMISLMDHHIGRILDALDRLGIADSTLVIFLTDHGHFLGQHGLIAKGAFHFEDMIKLPMLVRWPGNVPQNQVLSALQSQVDLAPTCLAAAEIPAPGVMQGVNQLGVWCGQQNAARDHIIVENRHQPTRLHLRTYVDERYKLTVYRHADYGELFDLEEDPCEIRNLWNEPSAVELKMRIMHRFLQAELEREPTRMPRIAGA
ncbi:MAG TPA: sulfatase-like hydrolase/transferase [Candidatus Hydrogenedentes bacterium]|nr:sulfatase-like hydrolase/transferase [Candidatus Hydrogenedentota bacterium]HPG66578.1 sulfatase-like hydrolase/transferase [Candidatus Hydrogenedentota bacterium]